MSGLSTLHASCVVLGEAGVLIRGASGAGKSTLARQLVLDARPEGHGRLVGDDRVRVNVCHGRLVARAVPAIAGRLEIRGIGILPVPFEPAAVVRLVVDLVSELAARMPNEDEAQTEIGGIILPRLACRLEDSLARLVLWRSANLSDRVPVR